MMHRAEIAMSLTLSDGDEVDLLVDASLSPGRSETYGQPAEDPDVEIHAIRIEATGAPCPAGIEAECERSDRFAAELLAGLQEDMQARWEDREPAGPEL